MTTLPPQLPPARRFVRFVWDKRSSILGASVWMFEVSALVSLLLAWLPIIGPFVGPVVGGLTGGRRAGTPGRALLCAILPALLLSLLIVALGAAAARYAQTPVVGALAALLAGAVGMIVVVHNVLLFAAALAGGWMRQRADEALRAKGV